MIACDIKNVKDDSVIAKVGDYELRKSDLINVLPTNISEIDSTQLVEKYISNWIINKSLFDKAEINLTESEINEIKNSTNKYYEELIIDKYRSKLLINNYDTIFSKNVLTKIRNCDEGNWEDQVPYGVSKIIKEKYLFGWSCDISSKKN